jgi:GWxTD domain-containing protein
MLSLIVESALRSLILGLVVWTLLRILRVRNPYTHSLMWRAVLLSALSMPLLMPIMGRFVKAAPTLSLEWMPMETTPRMLSSIPAAVPSPSSFSWSTLLVIIYAGVASALLLRVIAGISRSRRLRGEAVPLNEAWLEGSEVRVSAAIRVPVTVGSTVLVPADWKRWSTFQRQAVFLHERCHAWRRDFYVHLIAGVHRAIFWFNPLAWWLQYRLVELAEEICDDAALETVKDRPSYAEVLVRFAAEATQQRMLDMSMARGRTVASRVHRVLRETAVASPGSVIRRLFVVFCLVPVVGFAASSEVKPPAIVGQLRPVVPATQTAPAQQQALARRAEAATPALRAPQAAPPQDSLAKWPDAEVPFLISTAEREAFAKLKTDVEREMFIAAFWLQRDPTPGSVENEFRDEYYRRVVLANQRFTSPTGIPGWQSDRGRILIQFGLPDEIESHPQRTELDRATGRVISASPSESWLYRLVQGLGQNQIFVFVDSRGDGVYPLQSTSSGRNLDSVAPR